MRTHHTKSHVISTWRVYTWTTFLFEIIQQLVNKRIGPLSFKAQTGEYQCNVGFKVWLHSESVQTQGSTVQDQDQFPVSK